MVQFRPHCKPSHLGEPTQVKATKGSLHLIEVSNPNDQGLFIQIFDAPIQPEDAEEPLEGAVELGESGPIQSYCIDPAVCDDEGRLKRRGRLKMNFTPALEFARAISYALTTTPDGKDRPKNPVTVNLIFH